MGRQVGALRVMAAAEAAEAEAAVVAAAAVVATAVAAMVTVEVEVAGGSGKWRWEWGKESRARYARECTKPRATIASEEESEGKIRRGRKSTAIRAF